MTYDVAIVGAGPAGLAVAIGAAQRGLSTVVIDHQAGPIDKACGEGLMPLGMRHLAALGVIDKLDRSRVSTIDGIRYVQEDGSIAEATLPAPRGLAIRRLALSEAMLSRAKEVGVELRMPCKVIRHERQTAGVDLETSEGAIRAKLLVAADGLRSPIRRLSGLDGAPQRLRRFGLRQHFRVSPWTSFVEVYLSDGIEAYVTGAGEGRVGVAFLWEEARADGPTTIRDFLRRFPELEARIGDAEIDSSQRGAGPLYQTARSRVADRLALVGDAAGYIDALTGEGMSLAFAGASALCEVLPEALAKGATARSLAAYDEASKRLFRHYALVVRSMLELTHRPRLRRVTVHALAHTPRLFRGVLAWAIG